MGQDWLSIPEIAKELIRLPGQEFVDKHPGPFLIREADLDDPSKKRFKTLSEEESTDVYRQVEELLSSPDFLQRLRIDPQAYVAHPLAKDPGSPWQDRITIGRASNSDIVLSDPSISKLHAYFERTGEESAWMLFDCQSVNGTWLVADTPTRLEGNCPFLVKSGARIQFGRTVCELVSTQALCNAL